MLERFTAHGASCCAAPLCLNRQGPAQLTRRDGCDSSFDNRNGAMCSGPRVCGWTGCLPSGARANLPTVFSGFSFGHRDSVTQWTCDTLRPFWPSSPTQCWYEVVQLPAQPSLHTRDRAVAPQRCTQHRATPATNLQRATGLAPSTNRRQRMLPCNPRDGSPGPQYCPFVQIRLALRFRYCDPGYGSPASWLHCDCAWRRPHRDGAPPWGR